MRHQPARLNSCCGLHKGLGDGTGLYSSAPVQVIGLTDAVSLSVGYRHSCVVRSGGTVACWGSNAGGQLASWPNTDPNPLADVAGAT